MLKYVVSHIRRKMGSAFAMIFVALLIAATFCILEKVKLSQQENYERMHDSIPVTVSVSDLTGRNTENIQAPYWTVDVFLSGGSLLPDTLEAYVTDVRAKTTWNAFGDQRINQESVYVGDVVGITSPDAEPQLQKNNGGSVTWFPGYDESVLLGDSPVCLLPEALLPETGAETLVSLEYSRVAMQGGNSVTLSCQVDLQVAGTYQASEQKLYVPYRQAEKIWSDLELNVIVDSVQATLKDNDMLETLRTAASAWFAAPDLKGQPIPWGKMNEEYYLHALVIDDSQLTAAQNLLSKSIQINNICREILFVISAAVGFLTGFLMIRSRKKEIILMRTMGTPAYGIFVSFTLEQLTCVVLGVVLGGAAFLWRPLEQLLLFVVIYALGLTLALLVFLRKNLMATMKEDE